MAADLFETYVVTVGATMVLTALLLKGTGDMLAGLMALPLLIGGACIVTSIIGTYFVRLGGGTNVMGAMYKGFGVTALLSIPLIGLAIHVALGGLDTVIGGAPVTDDYAKQIGAHGYGQDANDAVRAVETCL